VLAACADYFFFLFLFHLVCIHLVILFGNSCNISIIMSNELPFFDIDDDTLVNFLKIDSCERLIHDRLSDHGLREYLFNLSKEEHFKVLDSAFYSLDQFNLKVKKCKKKIELSVFHLNIRSLNANQRKLCTLCALLELEFDVLILSEVWSYNIDFYHNIFEGYSFYADLPTNSSVGGLAMFINKGLTCKPRTDLNLITINDQIIENLWFEVKKNKTKYIVGGIYRHPNQSIQKFSDMLEVTLSKISKGKTSCIIAGDMNIDFLQVETNKNVENYLNNLILNNFLPVLLLPTRITARSATVIDHIYYYQGRVSKQEFKLSSGNLYSDVSDHLPNFVFLANISSRVNLNDRPFIRLFTDANKKKFRDRLVTIDWLSILYCVNDVNECYNNFISVLTENYEECFPLTRQSRRACKDKIWITKGLKISSKQKDKLYRKWILTKNNCDEINYKAYKRTFERLLRKAETLYYSAQFDDKINSIKQIWTNLNRVCSVKKNKKSNIDISKLNVSGKEIIDPAEISDAFNDFFCDIGPSLVKSLPSVPSCYTDYMGLPVAESIFVEDVTISELYTVIQSLKANKSSGADGISAQLIKDNVYYLCEPLVYLYNLSLMKGVVPDALKIAKIIPIFKKGDIHLACNYRPISLLSVFNKILEKIVYKRLFDFFLKHKILYKHQFGFRKNHSTSLALLEIVDSCYSNIDVNNKILGIYFDLQKAFDTVDHNILLHKLYNYGIRGYMFNWIKNYLTNRKQFTVINNVSSRLGDVVCGVPQGSVLGPLLFLIYINDISRAVPGDRLKLFADDTNLFIFGPDTSELELIANDCLKKMETWFVTNKLSLNIEKTCYTLFTSNNKTSNNIALNLFINNQRIAKVASCKYLGVIIDESLKWNEHIEYICKKLIKFTSIFYKLKDILPVACLSKLYYAFIYPHILYGIEVYANASKSVLDKLCKLNNKLLRILLRKKLATPVIDLYVAMNILPIPILHEMQLLVFIHKCTFHKYILPEIFINYFVQNNVIHDHNTRRKFGLHVISVKSTFGQRCSLYRGSKLWNSLPDCLRLSSSVAVFKKNLKLYLLKRTQSLI
jgi:Reverse transcriptase (RNA-dependent DNA polymerase)